MSLPEDSEFAREAERQAEWAAKAAKKFADRMAERLAAEQEDVFATKRLRRAWEELTFCLDDEYSHVYTALEEYIDEVDRLIESLDK